MLDGHPARLPFLELLAPGRNLLKQSAQDAQLGEQSLLLGFTLNAACECHHEIEVFEIRRGNPIIGESAVFVGGHYLLFDGLADIVRREIDARVFDLHGKDEDISGRIDRIDGVVYVPRPKLAKTFLNREFILFRVGPQLMHGDVCIEGGEVVNHRRDGHAVRHT